jgi:hypothetical protein
MVKCCGNASRNHKLKLVIGKAKIPQSVKGTEANCIPVQYYNQIEIFFKIGSASILFQKYGLS